MSEPSQTAAGDKPRCRICDGELPSPRTKRCPTCRSAQGAPCVVCGEPLLQSSSRCNACQSYQDARRFFAFPAVVLSLLLAIAGVTSAVFSAWLYIRDYNSHTRFKVSGSHGKILSMTVWNTGKKPSTLLSYTLQFGSLPVRDATLEVIPSDREEGNIVIMPDRTMKIGLWMRDFKLYPRCTQCPEYSKDAIRKLLTSPEYKNARLKLIALIEESNDDPGHQPHSWDDTFPAVWASEFIQSSSGAQDLNNG